VRITENRYFHLVIISSSILAESISYQREPRNLNDKSKGSTSDFWPHSNIDLFHDHTPNKS
jgi:hypothetical protein